MTISLKSIATATAQEVSNLNTTSLKSLLAYYGANSILTLDASQKMRAFYKNVGRDYGFLGAEKDLVINKGSNVVSRKYALGETTIRTQGKDDSVEGTITTGVQIYFTGLKCFEKSDKKILGKNKSDEPYVIISVIRLNPILQAEKDELVKTIKIGPFGKVTSGKVIDVPQVIYAGAVPGNAGIFVSATVFENDKGNPEEVRKAIEAKIQEYAAQAAAAIATALGAGQAGAGDFGKNKVAEFAAYILSLGIVSLLGLGDDEIGTHNFRCTPTEVIALKEQTYFDNSLHSGITTTPFNYPKNPAEIIVKPEGKGKYQVYFEVKGFEERAPIIPIS